MLMKKILTAKIVFINSVSGRLTRQLVARLLQKDVTVIVAAKNFDEVVELHKCVGKELAGRLVTELVDDYDYAKMADLVENIIEEFGPIDLALQFFGNKLRSRCLLDMQYDDWETVVGATLSSSFIFARTVLETMKPERKGCFLSLSSTADALKKDNSSLKNVLLASRIEMTKVLAREAKKWDIDYHHIYIDHTNPAYTPAGELIIHRAEQLAGSLIDLYNSKDEKSEAFLTL